MYTTMVKLNANIIVDYSIICLQNITASDQRSRGFCLLPQRYGHRTTALP